MAKLFQVYKQTAAASKKSTKAAPPKQEEKAEPVQVSPQDKAKADAFKSEGNKLLAAKDFAKAVEKYTSAIELDPSNAVYYANRAAAYSQLVNNFYLIVQGQS